LTVFNYAVHSSWSTLPSVRYKVNVRDGTCVYTVEKGWGDFRSLCGVVKGGREVWEREGMKEVESGRKGWSVQHRIEKLNRVLEFCVEEDGEVVRRWGEREGRR